MVRGRPRKIKEPEIAPVKKGRPRKIKEPVKPEEPIKKNYKGKVTKHVLSQILRHLQTPRLTRRAKSWRRRSISI